MGDPTQAKGLCGERRSNGVSESAPLGADEGYAVCDDATPPEAVSPVPAR